MSECCECGSTENIDEHHISYDPERTVNLCRSCHQTVHGADSHPLKPSDSAKKTTVQVDDVTRDELDDYALPGESADDTVSRLLEESDPPQFGVDAAEAERIAERVVERKMTR